MNEGVEVKDCKYVCIEMNRKNFLLKAGIITVIILIASSYYLTGKKYAEPEFAEAAKEEVTICYATLYSGLVQVAKEQDFFLHEGLNVTVKRSQTGQAAFESMLKGECNFSIAVETPVIFYTFYRKDFSFFATIGTSNNFTKIIARSDRGIEKPDGLKGKRIATQKGTFSHYFLHVFLLKNNISENEILINFNKAEELPQMLADGEIDAFSMGEPHISNAKKMIGEKYTVFADPKLSISTVNILTLNSYIKDKPQVINGTLKALLQAEKYVRSNPEITIKTLSKHYGVEESEISILIENNELRVSLDQYLLSLFENEARWIIRTNQTNKTVIPNYIDFIYTESLKELEPEAVTIIT